MPKLKKRRIDPRKRNHRKPRSRQTSRKARKTRVKHKGPVKRRKLPVSTSARVPSKAGATSHKASIVPGYLPAPTKSMVAGAKKAAASFLDDSGNLLAPAEILKRLKPVDWNPSGPTSSRNIKRFKALKPVYGLMVLLSQSPRTAKYLHALLCKQQGKSVSAKNVLLRAMLPASGVREQRRTGLYSEILLTVCGLWRQKVSPGSVMTYVRKNQLTVEKIFKAERPVRLAMRGKRNRPK